MGVQSAARIPLWSAGLNIGVSSAVGLVYPCISIIFDKCIVNQLLIRQQRMYVHCCPCIPRTHLRCLERIKTCFKSCLCCTSSERLSEKSFLLAAPETHSENDKTSEKANTSNSVKTSDFLQEIDLSAAPHLTDANLELLVKKRPHLQKLTLGGNQKLTALGYAFLAELKELKELHLAIPKSQLAGSLNSLNLKEVFGNLNGLKIFLDVSDSTISCFPLTFLRQLPKDAEIYVQLKHQPIPRSSIIFESRRGASDKAIWPETISRLIRFCPVIMHLDLDQSFECGVNVFEEIVSNYPMLRSLKIRFADDINDRSIAGLVGLCPDLEKVHFLLGHFTDISIAMLVGECRNLSDVTLAFSPALTNRSLEHLSRSTSLKSCKIQACPIGNEGVNFLLNRKPALANLEIIDCSGVSDEMLVKLVQCSSAADQPFIKELTSYHRQLKATPLPLYQMHSLSPIIFQTLIDNLNKENSSSINTQGGLQLTFLDHLGVSKHTKLKLRASCLQTLAHYQLSSLLIPFWQFKKGFIKQHDRIPAIAYALEHVLPECLQKTVETYSVFIRKTYPTEYCEQLMKHLNTVLEKSKLAFQPNLPQLQLILPWLYSDKFDQITGFLTNLWTTPESPIKTLVETCAKLTGEEGLKLNWNEEQRCAAFLGVILSHLNWLQGEMITHHPLEMQLGDEGESKERKESEGKRGMEGKYEERDESREEKSDSKEQKRS